MHKIPWEDLRELPPLVGSGEGTGDWAGVAGKILTAQTLRCFWNFESYDSVTYWKNLKNKSSEGAKRRKRVRASRVRLLPSLALGCGPAGQGACLQVATYLDQATLPCSQFLDENLKLLFCKELNNCER